jgi:Domain of unknown function (DUF1858)/NnrS protein
MAAAAGLFVFALNLHRPAVQDESSDAPGPHERLIRTAYVWLVIAFVIEAWYATKGVTGGFQPDILEASGARPALALGFVTQMIFGVGSRALPVFAGKKLYSERLAVVAWILINIATLLRVGHAVIPAGSATFRFDHIAVAGGVALIALVVFAYNIMRSVRAAGQGKTDAKEDPMQAQAPTQAYEVTEGSVVSDVIAKVPGSLEMLISYGFKPLADAELRARVASKVTLGMVCGMHGIDVHALIADLASLRGGAASAGAGITPKQRILNALRPGTPDEYRRPWTLL